MAPVGKLRVVVCVTIFMIGLFALNILWDGQMRNLFRVKKWTGTPVHDWNWKNLDPNHKHPFETNMWYRYVKVLAKAYNKSNCFVCSHMPHSSSHLTLYATPMPYHAALCFYRMSVYGRSQNSYFYEPYTPELLQKMFQRTYEYNFTAEGTDVSCADVPVSSLNWTQKGPVASDKVIIPRALPSCAHGHGTGFPWCLEKRARRGAEPIGILPVNMCCVVLIALDEGKSNPFVVVDGGWWLCGTKVYMSLPRRWSGRCAPVKVSDHTFFAEAHEIPAKVRARRSVFPTFKPHDDKMGSDVPQEFKHWNTASKIALCLVPHIGVGKNMLRLETVDYRFQVWVNASITVNEGQNREIDALRIVAMQNRMVLDLLTAGEGGVCVKIGTACCTYIPDEVNTNVTAAMEVMKNLRKAMSQDAHPESRDPDWLNWLLSGEWWHKLLMVFALIIGIFSLFFLFLICCIPCLRAMVSSVVSDRMYANSTAMTELDFDFEFDSRL
ncbi:uncharacterized protein LOC129604728 [Betta splendens]|uniref:Uncharacterized protein LOC129604728 n=1 Tax=Betta splendens TaxID=158456 RepID=A0A9W2Y3A2_BETSP|nr:uncharacterized protein LOC129604728 [Betta splendens]